MTTHAAEFQRKLRTAREAVDLVRPADTVAVPIATGQPAAFLAALGDRDDWNGLTIFGGILTEPYSFLQRKGLLFASGFFGPVERMGIAAGWSIDYLPADFLGWERYARSVRPRVLVSAVAPMDDRGFLSFGLHAGANVVQLNTTGCSFEQNIESFTHNVETGPKNQGSYQE